jgi:uncharacterized membrane protein
MRTIESEFCSVLHREDWSDAFVTDSLANSFDRFHAGVGIQPWVGILSLRNNRTHSDHSDHHAAARPILRVLKSTMNPKVQMLIAGAGGAATIYSLTRLLGGKHIKTLPYGYGIKLKKAVTVNAPPGPLYMFWRRLENLPMLFDNLVSVKRLDESRSRWTLRVPAGLTLEWDAEITVDRKHEMIGWRSLPGADLDNAGYVRFERATGERGTVVRVALQYNPPAGKLGAALAALLGEKPSSLIEEALRRFKQIVETGEIARTTEETKLPQPLEPVEAASEESFPASDAPAWTGTTGPLVI